MQPFFLASCFFLLISLPLFAIKVPSRFKKALSKQEVPPDPWFTGPLLTPTDTNVPPGHYDIEPYLFVTTRTGIYNKHWRSVNIPHFQTVNFSPDIFIGSSKSTEVEITPQFIYQSTQGISSVGVGDIPVQLSFQIDQKNIQTYLPAIKLSFLATVPVGRYQHLNPLKLGTDMIGMGSWAPGVNLVLGELFHFKKFQFFTLRASFTAIFPNWVHVRGFHSYGGGYGTAGKVRIGTQYFNLIGIEYSFNRRWAFACDIQYLHTNKVSFSGTKGNYKDGSPAINKLPSSEQLSFAPAMEYNWNANVGIIVGCWFTAIGRNSINFRSGVAAFNVYY